MKMWREEGGGLNGLSTVLYNIKPYSGHKGHFLLQFAYIFSYFLEYKTKYIPIYSQSMKFVIHPQCCQTVVAIEQSNIVDGVYHNFLL